MKTKTKAAQSIQQLTKSINDIEEQIQKIEKILIPLKLQFSDYTIRLEETESVEGYSQKVADEYRSKMDKLRSSIKEQNAKKQEKADEKALLVDQISEDTKVIEYHEKDEAIRKISLILNNRNYSELPYMVQALLDQISGGSHE